MTTSRPGCRRSSPTSQRAKRCSRTASPTPRSPHAGSRARRRGSRACEKAVLQHLAKAARVPVGLENLALALGRADVRDQGPFLDALLEPLDGYLVLDLHDIHCQAENFATDPRTLPATYPRARVRRASLWRIVVGAGRRARAPGHARRRGARGGIRGPAVGARALPQREGRDPRAARRNAHGRGGARRLRRPTPARTAEWADGDPPSG